MQIRKIITERHNIACSMILKAISETGFLGPCFVCMDIGSSERLTVQNPQISNTAETRIIPKWLFPPCFSDKTRFTSSRLDAVLVAPISAKTKKQQTSNEGGWVRSGKGKLRGQPLADPPSPDSTDPRSQHSSTRHSPHRGQVL